MMKTNDKLSERNEKIRNDYVSGIRVSELVSKYHLSMTRIYTIISPIHRKREKYEDRNTKIRKSYRDGTSAIALAKDYHLSRTRIYAILTKDQTYCCQKAKRQHSRKETDEEGE